MRILICVGLLCGIGFSYELWFSVSREFLRVPFVFELPIFIDRIFGICLVVSLILVVVSLRPKIFMVSAVSSLVLLIFFDQMRLQPWVYQYLLLFGILALQTNDEKDSAETFSLTQIIIAALYFWSGLQKLNFTFSHETLPKLLEPLQTVFPSIQFPFVFIGIGIALIETFIGCGLLFRKTRNFAVILAVTMHAMILTVLIAKNYNSVVWIWNAVLIAIVLTAFWKNDGSIKQIFDSANVKNWKIQTAKIIAFASILLPILSFFGFWDSYLSGALYSGNVAVGVVRINDNLYEKLPPKARESVFQTKNSGEKMLPFVEWSLSDLNVPAYPEPRVFKQITAEICHLSENKKQVELIVKDRPSIIDGNYNVTRINCEQLEKR